MAGMEKDIVAGLPGRPAARILRAAEAQAWQDGFAFLETARQEAAQLREAGRRAYAGEYAQGYEDGLAAGREEASRLVAEATVKLDGYFAGLEDQLAQLVLEVTRRLLGAFEQDDLVARAARQAIAEIRRAKYLKVTVHPDAFETVRAALDAMAKERRFGFAVEVEPDGTLARDACILATEAAVVDASVATQLEAIAAALGPARKGQP
jgi:type III secretion protein L